MSIKIGLIFHDFIPAKPTESKQQNLPGGKWLSLYGNEAELDIMLSWSV
jgi:hypothetical protein